jgi:hypothetical protein
LTSVELEDLERNDLDGSIAYYGSIRESLAAMPTHQRMAFIEPLLRLHDDPRVLSRALKARFPGD